MEKDREGVENVGVVRGDLEDLAADGDGLSETALGLELEGELKGFDGGRGH